MSTLISPQVTHDLDPVNVANYLINKDAERPNEQRDVSQMKLHKLMYLAQANYLAATGRRLFNAEVEAFDNGPVIAKILRRFSHRGKVPLAAGVLERKPVTLPEDAMAFVDQVWAIYKDYTPSQLWTLTHAQAPYKDHYVPDGIHTVIPDVDIASFFRAMVPTAQRVLHPEALVIPAGFLDDLDDDEVAARAASVFA